MEHHLGGKLEDPPSIHVVRDVAPTKLMLCVSFRVPAAVAFNGRGGGEDAGEEEEEEEEAAAVKRQRR